MKILIVSGFLGAGKTTFIQTMARATGLPFVVYENEYAGAGVDTERLTADADLEVYESLENCVCCSGKADFAQSLLTIHSSLDPEYLVVEPTGLARLSNLIANVRQVLYGDMELLAPVTVVDAGTFWQQRSSETFIDQLCHSGMIVLSKAERLYPEEQERIETELARLAPQAQIVCRPWEQLEPAWFQTLLGNDSNGISAFADMDAGGRNGRFAVGAPDCGVAETGEGMDRLTVSDAALPTPAHLVALLDAFAIGRCGDVVRAKGCLPCGGQWVRFDYVGGIWEMIGAEPAARASFVVIGRQVDAEAIGAVLAADNVHFHAAQAHHATGTYESASIEVAVA